MLAPDRATALPLGPAPSRLRPASRPAGLGQRYRHIARYYDLVYGAFLGHGSRVLVHVRPPERHERVLEIGVGTGFSLPHYPEGVEVAGIDVCPEMIAVARRKRLPRARARVSLFTMDAHDLAFRSQTFDLVLLPHSLGLMDDPPRVLAEVARVARNGAELRILHTFEWRPRLLRRIETALYDAFEVRQGWGRPLNFARTTAWCAKNGFELVWHRRLAWKRILVFRKH
jgi:phosphatidylethanolamine/phosphatidyl-N-methylethanolamine N-methyltransferase